MDKAGIIVRLEEEKDHRRVEEITRDAFRYPGRIEQGKIGCPYEHWMVHELRHRDGIPELSLIAQLESETIVGHIICSKAIVKKENYMLPVLNFGPLSVLPEYQRQGVGKALVRSMIDKAKKLGYGAILFFGRPEYYPRFGFKEAAFYGISDADGNNYAAFMAMELKEGYLANVYGGRFLESDIYNDELNRETVRAFDRKFMLNKIKKIAELTDRNLLGLEGLADSTPRYKVRAILRNISGLYAVMYEKRTDLYALPGGGVEDGEEIIDALKREMLEETGCSCDSLEELGYVYENRAYCNLEQYTYFYIVTSEKEPEEVHFTHEEIDVGTELLWCTMEEVVSLIKNGQPKTNQQKFIQARDMAALAEYAEHQKHN